MRILQLIPDAVSVAPGIQPRRQVGVKGRGTCVVSTSPASSNPVPATHFLMCQWKWEGEAYPFPAFALTLVSVQSRGLTPDALERGAGAYKSPTSTSGFCYPHQDCGIQSDFSGPTLYVQTSRSKQLTATAGLRQRRYGAMYSFVAFRGRLLLVCLLFPFFPSISARTHVLPRPVDGVIFDDSVRVAYCGNQQHIMAKLHRSGMTYTNAPDAYTGYVPPQQNLWVDSGSGRRPNV